ncbi:MAG: hypothetical protein ABSD75_24700 [Terriglobales bacterium]
MEPLVYKGPAEGMLREQWQLKSPKEILDLKVCDMAMGSGAFLVQACRYLAERLTEAWENEEKKHPGEMLATPAGGFSLGAPSERLVPQDAAERLAIARRIIADRCLYGVDINPMAVEMAKLSLWLITLDAKRPFTFLDHAFKCGDSLLGLSNFKQLENFSLRPEGGKQIAFSTMNLWRHVDEAKKKREALEVMPSDTPEQIAAKVALYAESEEAVAKLKAAGDVLVALELKGLKGSAYEADRESTADQMMAYWQRGANDLRGYAREALNGRRTLHWPLAFPEIMERGGFDAFIGNPPFMGGAKLETALGGDYRALIVARIANGVTGTRGTADLATYFLLRAEHLTLKGGMLGLIVTNSLGQGDAREVGLSQVLKRGSAIVRSVPSSCWPGQASVFYAMVWVFIGEWCGDYHVDGHRISRIDASMNAAESERPAPAKLNSNAGIAFEGAKLSGEGFVVPGQAARGILERDSRSAQVLKPYLTGALLNGRAVLAPDEYIITFYDYPLSRETAPDGYLGPVASEFPECLDWVDRNVKPQREELQPTTPWNRKLRQFWWQLGQWRWALDAALVRVERVLVLSRVTPHVMVDWADKTWVFSDRLTVFAVDNAEMFALLQSSFHEIWSRRYGTTNLTLLSYSPAACFLTLPLPSELSGLRTISERYYLQRRSARETLGEGLTDIYNRFHDPSERHDDIARLRALHLEMDQAAAVAYGWNDLDLGHGFHETKQGLRYTISETARGEVLDRLLALNHERHAEEEAEKIRLAAQSRPIKKRNRKPKTDSGNAANDLFDLGESKYEQE